MFDPIENGSVVNIQGLDCHLPPEGYVYNILTKQLEQREIFSRSDNPAEQYWERIPLPSWYKEVMRNWDKYDRNKKEDDPDFYDENLEPYKAQEWDRRLNGFWFMNNGKPTYITGPHYMFLQWWQIDIGYPKFRVTDLEYFYFLQHCVENPNCMGMLEITKRRFGKTFRGGLFLFEYITRTKKTNAGIQSKTGADAKKVYNKAVINPFIMLPKFFRPEYDMGGGMRPKTSLVFQQTNVKGKKAELGLGKDELGSMLDYEDADLYGYDGQKIHRYFADEWAKCFGKGTKIRMYDGSVKKVEDIQNGELVMGDDSTPRLTYGKTNGVEKMYKIIPNSGEPIICNESHILSLKLPTQKEPINISVKDYVLLKDWEKKNLMLWRVGVEYAEKKHFLEPYFLGAWLGDGNERCSKFSSNDKEIIDYMSGVAKSNNLYLVQNSKYDYHISRGNKNRSENKILSELRRLNLVENKHIPKEYLIDSRENRLSLLAGLLDTDGSLYERNNIDLRYEITQKRKELALDIQELAKSCGFKATLYKRVTSMVRNDGSVYKCDVYKVCIYGEIHEIPCKVQRKKAKKTITQNKRKNPLRSGFKLECIGEGEYYGFCVDRNHLFLLEDYTVVHNTDAVNIYDRHEVIRYCLMDDEGNIIGKALYSSTVEKSEKADDKSDITVAAKKLWDESDHTNLMENGRTPSGLYRFFMTADRSRHFDKYGYPNVEKTVQEILADRESVKNNPRALAARTRKEARTIEEAWMEDGDKCVFNIINIFDREAKLKETPIPKRRIIYYMDGESQRVKWRDIQKGEEDFCWEVSPDFDLLDDLSNRAIKGDGYQKPGNKKKYVISVDSYSNSQGGKRYGSKASAWIGRKDLRKAVGHLYGRPKEKDELHRQVMLAAIYCGCEAFYEHTADDYLSYFRERGKIAYLGLYPMSLIDTVKRGKENLERHRGTPITPFSLTKQLDNGISYFENYCHLIDFPEIFPVAKKFDPYDRTKFDIMVSFLILVTVMFEPEYNPPPPPSPLVRVYPNTGAIPA